MLDVYQMPNTCTQSNTKTNATHTEIVDRSPGRLAFRARLKDRLVIAKELPARAGERRREAVAAAAGALARAVALHAVHRVRVLAVALEVLPAVHGNVEEETALAPLGAAKHILLLPIVGGVLAVPVLTEACATKRGNENVRATCGQREDEDRAESSCKRDLRSLKKNQEHAHFDSGPIFLQSICDSSCRQHT
jgi:hypothetical protein